MRKRIVAVFLLLVCVMGSVPAFAHDTQEEHDRDLKYALFDSRGKVLSDDEKLIFNAIADAAALTIDQFSTNDSQRWKEGTYNKLQDDLQRLGLPVLTTSFDDLNLNSRVAADGKILLQIRIAGIRTLAGITRIILMKSFGQSASRFFCIR